ncbi:uncharacterized protein MELLADRAFT_67284 [Melampsora larici-populina 98AG31]|uniref:Uncharacterized protein n=1 Tax=Melampsora larici-populina (strain 98AG31 / pathotype 3-4-7) TaxID=747676 RepID=F4S2I5_MELLP|nr:uncharacterized protein MELLADRAFT_67284 [Melampsora larici-populina 98AG31]EGG01201.1 hypothetical protein MELLADRAFT_67284 [Melampsora larici-populina 98AG31]
MSRPIDSISGSQELSQAQEDILRKEINCLCATMLLQFDSRLGTLYLRELHLNGNWTNVPVAIQYLDEIVFSRADISYILEQISSLSLPVHGHRLQLRDFAQAAFTGDFDMGVSSYEITIVYAAIKLPLATSNRLVLA